MKIGFMSMRPSADWGMVVRKIGIRWVEDTTGILAVDYETGTCVAGCIMQNWTYTSVQVHFWIDTPVVLRHGFLEEVAKYILNDAGREMLIGLVPSDNVKALKMDKHIGFRETYRIKDGFKPGVDTVVLEATREDLLRWLPKENIVEFKRKAHG